MSIRGKRNGGVPVAQRWSGCALGLVLLGGLLGQTGVTEDWPQWRGPDRNGISQETDWVAEWPQEGPPKLWEASVGVGFSSMAVSEGRVYTMGNTDYEDSVYALDAETGEVLWEHTYPCSPEDPNNRPGPRCTPTVDEGRVYTISREGHLFCLDAESGEVLWRKHLVEDFNGREPKWGYSGSPLVVDDRVIVEPGGQEGFLGFFSSGSALVALDKETGEVAWSSGTAGAGYSSPVTFDHNGETGIMMLHAARLAARQFDDGEILWEYPWKTSYDVNAATPIVQGNRVFISSGYNKGGVLLDFADGEPSEVWKNQTMRNQFSTCVLLDGYLYGFDERTLKCVEFDTGKERWAEDLYGKGALIAAGDRLIIQADRGLVAVGRADPNRYEEISRTQPFGGKDVWVAPVLANGRIYARSHEDLVCLDVRPGSE